MLRREVEELLAATGPEGTLKIEEKLLDRRAALETVTLPGYRVGRLLGRGGMGEVYLATREGDDFNQQVAVKLMRAERAGVIAC